MVERTRFTEPEPERVVDRQRPGEGLDRLRPGRGLDGRTVIVTGGARGMGAAHARGFVAEGASVVIADILAAEGEALADELGEQAVFTALDVTDETGWADTVERAIERFGEVAVLVNNAGIERHGTIAGSDPGEWRQVIDVNLIGTYLGMRSVVPSMTRRGGGSIVNISSAAGMTAIAGFSAYVSSKWAVRGLTKTAAIELSRHAIRVNSVHPGLISTPMADELAEDAQRVQTERYAVPRPGDPEEITQLVLYLASDESAFCTGSEFTIDGGYLLGPVRGRRQKPDAES